MGWMEGLITIALVAAVAGFAHRVIDRLNSTSRRDWCKTNKH